MRPLRGPRYLSFRSRKHQLFCLHKISRHHQSRRNISRLTLFNLPWSWLRSPHRSKNQSAYGRLCNLCMLCWSVHYHHNVRVFLCRTSGQNIDIWRHRNRKHYWLLLWRKKNFHRNTLKQLSIILLFVSS